MYSDQPETSSKRKFFDNHEDNSPKKFNLDTHYQSSGLGSQVKVLEKSVVIFQGEHFSLNKFIEGSDENAKRIINSQELDVKIKIGNKLKDLGEITDYYIPRRICTQVTLNKTKIEEGIKNNLVSDFFVISGTDTGLGGTNKMFVFDHHNDESADQKFQKLCVENTDSNIHWLRCKLGKLVLHKSQGSITSLVKYREIEDFDSILDNKTSKNSLTETKYLENKSKIMIIADTTGTGKSTLLTSLSLKLKKDDPSLWIFKINLHDYSKVFKQEIENRNCFYRSDVDLLIDFLIYSFLESQDHSKLTNNIERDLFENCIIGQGKIALLFDGFDEISPNYQNIVIDLLQALKNTKVDKIIITTFSKSDQITFLTKYWIKNLKFKDLNQEHENRLSTYVNSLIEKFSISNNNRAEEFMGIPLHTMMLAEIFQENIEFMEIKLEDWVGCKEFIASDNCTNKYPKLPHKFDLLGLYKNYIKNKLCMFHLKAKQHTDFSKAGVEQSVEKNYENFLERHNGMALSVLLDHYDLNKLLSETERQKLDSWIKDIKDFEINEGIINKIIDNKPHFIHRTFAEYFAAFAFIEKMHLKPEIICSLVDNIINHTSSVFLIRIANYQNNLGKTILHYAVEYNSKNIIKLVLNYKNDIEENEILMHGSFKNKKYENSNIVKFVNKKDNQGKTALDYAEDSELDTEISFELLFKGANIDGLTPKYLKKLTYLLRSKIIGVYAKQDNIYRKIQEKLLLACPEIFPELRIKDQSRLLSYFFLHGRIKVIDTLLSSITDEDRRKLILNADDNSLTPLDLVNCSDQISDDERLEITKYLLENGGTEVKNFVGLSDKSYITSILQGAVQSGHMQTFKYFIFEEIRTCYYLHLSLAVKNQQYNIIKYLMENHRSNIKDKGNIPLHAVVEFDGSLNIIKYCIDNGEEINAKNDKGETPLFYAIYKRRLNVIQYLVDHGADIDRIDQQGYTALNHAIEKDQRDVINYLFWECKAKINFTSELIRNKIEFYQNPSVFNLNLSNQHGMPPLHCAIKLKQLEWAKFIIQHGAEINITDHEEKTPLHWAAELQQTEIVEILLQYGAIFDAKCITNSTPFDLVYQSVSNKISWLLNLLEALFNSQNLMQNLDEQLLKIESNSHLKDWGPYGLGHPNVWSSDNPMLFILNAKDAGGKTLFHKAAETNDLQALNILLEFNYEYIGRREHPQCETDRRYKYYQSISINAIDSFGNTPLHLAAQNGYTEVVSLLLEYGAIFNAENLQGKTPDDLAEKNHHDNVTKMMQAIQNLFSASEQNSLVEVKICINENAYINAKNRNGKTPLHFAASSDQIDIVHFLLKIGVNIEALDIYNRTPLHLATENNNIEIVKLLLQHDAIFNAKDKWDKAPYEFEYNQCVNLLIAIKDLFNYIESDNPVEIIDYMKMIEKDFKVDFGTIISIRDNQYNSILDYAASSNDSNIAEFLLKNGTVQYVENKIQQLARSFFNSHDIFVLLDSIEKMFKIIDYIYQENKIVYPDLDMHIRNYQGTTLLHKAAEYNKFYLVKRLVRAGAKLNALDNSGKTPLYCVAVKGMLGSAKILMEHGADVNCQDFNGKTPLHCAAERGMLDTAKFLIEHDAYIHFADNDNKTPLYCVVEKGMLASAKFLIEHGADIDCMDEDDKTPLHCCAEKGMFDMAKLLIENNADVNSIDAYHKTPLNCAAKRGVFDLVQLFIEHDADVNSLDYYGKTPLHYAAIKVMLDSAKLLIDHGAEVNSQDYDGNTPLHCVAEKGVIDSVKFLIEHDAYIHFADNDNKTPLYCIVEKGMLASAKFLIEHGADIDCMDEDDKTPLHCCAEKGMFDMAKLLIENNADVNSIDAYHKTPLNCAAKRGVFDLVQLFIEHDADVNSLDYYGKTPLHYAAIKVMLDSAKLLIDHGAEVNSQDYDGNTPLHCVAEKGVIDSVKFLIEHGADINIGDKNKNTALQVATQYANLDIVQFLASQG